MLSSRLPWIPVVQALSVSGVGFVGAYSTVHWRGPSTARFSIRQFRTSRCYFKNSKARF